MIPPRVFILASNAFAASTFVDFCLDKGCRVAGFSRSPEYLPELSAYRLNPKAKTHFEFRQYDLNRHLDSIATWMEEFKPDYVVDFAGQGMVAQSWERPEQWYQTNIVSKVKFHERLRKLKSLKVYLRFSTPEVYGNTPHTIKEDAPLNPSTPYAVSHAAIDMSTRAFFSSYGFPAVLTRASNIYGPYQQLYRIIPRALLYRKLGKKLKLDGGGTAVRNFVFMRDVCEALWLILEKPYLGETYHIASKEYISVRDLVEQVAKMSGLELRDLAEIGPERPGKDQAYLLNTEKIESHYNWKPKINLAEGLSMTSQWIEKNFNALAATPLEYIHKE